MKIGMIGVGKLGLPVALAIESRGHDVCVHDINPEVKTFLEQRKIPYREEGLQPLLDSHDLTWCDTVAEVVKRSDIVFVAIQTPHAPEYEGVTPMPEARADFDYTALKAGLTEVAEAHRTLKSKAIVAVISTCLPGTFRREFRPLFADDIPYAYTPQFIAMGTVLDDYLHPEFNLIGVDDPVAAVTLESFYATINDAPSVVTDITTAEGVKLSYNTWLTAKTVIANAWGEMCERLGMDFDAMGRAWSLSRDRLISPRYMKAGMSDGGGCFPPGEIVITEHGPRPIETIRPNDRVLTIDGTLQPVIKTWVRHYEGDLIEVKVQGTPPSRMTADHPVMAREDLRMVRKDGRKQTDKFPRSDMREVAARDLTVDHLMTWPQPQVDSYERPEHATDEYVELAGWYLSEGSVYFDGKGSGRLSWSLHIDEEAEAERIAELATACAPPRPNGRGGSAKTVIELRPETKGRVVRRGSIALARQLVGDFGKGAKEKRLPPWVLWGEDKVASLILKGMLLGDGHFCDNGITLSTISPDLAWGALILIKKLGIHATLRDIPPRVSAKGQAHQRAYEVQIKNRREARALAKVVGLPYNGTGLHEVSADRWHPVKSLKRTPYRGPVHNLWVAGTNTYVVSSGAVHNCHPRDNIAMSWLANEVDMSYNLWDALMTAREEYEGWHAEYIAWVAKEVDLPIVLLGRAFKPETDIETGSAAILLANILRMMGENFLHVNDMVPLTMPAVYFIATANKRYADYEFPPGSVVLDPFGIIRDQEGVQVRRIGRR